VYVDLLKTLFGGIIRTDSTELNILSEGKYYQGNKSGRWVFYSFGTKVREGKYWNDLKDGKWSYYYTKYVDNNSNPLPYSGELFLTETYENGIKSGLSERFSSLEEVKYLCDTSIHKNVNPLDTCTKQVYKKEFQSFYYKNDELHGPCTVKDSIGTIIFKGNFLNGKKDGEWIESYKNDDIDNNSFYIFEKGKYYQGKRTGKWQEYVNEDFIWKTSYYSNGKLNGEMISHLKNGGKREIKKFNDDFLKELIVYDSIGYTVVSKYEILNETNYSLKVRKSEYNEGRLTASLEYYMKKDDPVLNYNFFELFFMLKTGKLSDGESGYPDGELIVYDEKGEVKINGKLKKEDKIGIWKYNYPDQGVQIQIEFTNNVPGVEKYYTLNTGAIFSGIFKFVDDENKINEERKIKDGLRNGTTVYYDFNGEKIKKEKYKDGLKK
jgi:antitoxin component YwqK of YwqJK toxin-antitoxin module